MRVELDHENWRSDFRIVETVLRPDNVAAWTLESCIVQHDEPGALPATAEAPAAVSREATQQRVVDEWDGQWGRSRALSD